MPSERAQPVLSSPGTRLCALSDEGNHYRRRARRLRSIFRHQPARLHRSLQRLADEVDHRPSPPSRPMIPARSLRASRFEFMVRDAMSSGPLRYSRRLALLKAGEAMGLGRFEANLILAIEHNRTHPFSLDIPRRNWFPAAAWIIAGMIQSAMIAAAWLVMRA